jgi:hypothetical protein
MLLHQASTRIAAIAAVAVCAIGLSRAQVTQYNCSTPPADQQCDAGEQRLVSTDSDSFGFFTSQWNSTTGQVPKLSLNKFVPSSNPAFMDELIQVDITITGTARGNYEVENRDTLNGCQLNVDIIAENLDVIPVDPALAAILNLPPINVPSNTTIPLGPFDGVDDGLGASGATGATGPDSQSVCFRITGANLALFVDGNPGDGVTEQLLFDHMVDDNSGCDGCAPVTCILDPEARVQVDVRYVYCRVQEQGPCVERHRRMPSSLLLYPEFDNREGSLTLITVTNTNCDQDQGPVDVEFVYIDERNCLEDNFTVRLTPCDTFTAVTSYQNPNMERGYIYAFAKSTTTGQAISFNYLIGNLMAINGIDHFDWSVNPVAFKGVTGHRQPTDVDADGVRDLDDLEYWQAPERLFVPRFIGQDEFAPCPGGGVSCDGDSAGFKSEIVLINLSGGAQFGSTIVFFQIFNDNEEPFSASWDFYCWDRVRLARVNGAFTEDFLDDTTDAPNEILGASYRESGWFWFDGLSADSTAENIQNPAVYGFLIERVRYYYAADLPWEYCSQENGDLLPTGPFGDPRPGFPAGQLGDNQ